LGRRKTRLALALLLGIVAVSVARHYEERPDRDRQIHNADVRERWRCEKEVVAGQSPGVVNAVKYAAENVAAGKPWL